MYICLECLVTSMFLLLVGDRGKSGGGLTGSSSRSVMNEVDFDPLSASTSPVVIPSTTSLTGCLSLSSPPYQSEVIISAIGSPLDVGYTPIPTTVDIGSGSSAGLTFTSVWNTGSRSPVSTATKDHDSLGVLNWNTSSTTATTSTSLVGTDGGDGSGVGGGSDSLANNGSDDGEGGRPTGCSGISVCGGCSSNAVAVDGLPLNSDSRDDKPLHNSSDGLTAVSSSDVDESVKSSTSRATAAQSTHTSSVGLDCHLPSSGPPYGSGPEHKVSQSCLEPTQWSSSLWDEDWPTTEKPAERGIASVELIDRDASDHRPPPPTIFDSQPPRRQPPLRLILIRTVGTDNIWSSKPAESSDPPARTAASRPARDICGSLSESALTDLGRWTDLSYLRAGHDHHQLKQRLSANHSINPPSFTVCLHAVFIFVFSLPLSSCDLRYHTPRLSACSQTSW